MQDTSLSLPVFSESLDLKLFTRKDAIRSDADIAKALGTTRLVSLRQVHGDRAVVVREPSSRVIEADAVATDITDITLTIRFADCQGFVVFDPTKKILAVIHAGWKGMCQKIISSTFLLLTSSWGVVPAAVYVFAGPSLCRSCAAFTDPRAEAPALSTFIHGRTIDLRAAADAELLSLGVRADRIQRSPECTRCHPEKYVSYRGGDREEVMAGFTNCFAVTMKEFC